MNLENLSKKELIAMLRHYMFDDKEFGGLKRGGAYNQALPEIASHNGSVSICEVDTNFLKDMNDKFGHAAGNAYLRTQADAVVDTMAISMGLLNLAKDGSLAVPPSTDRTSGTTDAEYIQSAKQRVIEERDIYRIGGDEFRILLRHNARPERMSELDYQKNILDVGHRFMQQALQRFKHLWQQEREHIQDDHGNPCEVSGSFGYGVASTAEVRLKGKSIPEVQKFADNRAFYHKSWQKLAGHVALPAGRSMDIYLDDPRLKGVAEIETIEELLAFIDKKEAKYSGVDRRKPTNSGPLPIVQEDK